jgi:phosphoenolpyruvate-protein kinase (PTS system EI component)
LIKKIIRSVTFASCQALAEQALAGRSIAEIRAQIQTWMANNVDAEK